MLRHSPGQGGRTLQRITTFQFSLGGVLYGVNVLPHSASQGRTMQRITKLFVLAVISIVSVVATQSKTKQNSAVHSNTSVLPWWCSLWRQCVDTQPRSKQNSAVRNNISVLPGVLGGVIVLPHSPRQGRTLQRIATLQFCLVFLMVLVLPHCPSQSRILQRITTLFALEVFFTVSLCCHIAQARLVLQDIG